MKVLSSSIVLLSFALSIGCASTNKTTGDQAEATPKIETNMTEQKGHHGDATAYNCMVQDDKRVITLDKEAHRCEVHYTKFGNKTQVAWAQATPSICKDVFSKIRKNIEEKGFKCTSLNEDAKPKSEEQPNKTAKVDKDRATASSQ